MALRIVFEGGQSDTDRLDLAVDRPPAYVSSPGSERYDLVLDHHDQPMEDIAGR